MIILAGVVVVLRKNPSRLSISQRLLRNSNNFFEIVCLEPPLLDFKFARSTYTQNFNSSIDKSNLSIKLEFYHHRDQQIYGIFITARVCSL